MCAQDIVGFAEMILSCLIELMVGFLNVTSVNFVAGQN